MDGVWVLKFHDGGSYHDPILLSFDLAQAGQLAREKGKVALFKANLGVLRDQRKLERLKLAWEEGLADCDDPVLDFVKASINLRQKFIKCQNAPYRRDIEMQTLRDKVCTLKVSILGSTNEEDMQNWVDMEEDLHAAEFEAAHAFQRLAMIKWLGEGDEPSKFFFATANAKRERETMMLLITEEGESIRNSSCILKEVEKQCRVLFSTEICSLPEKRKTTEARAKLLANTYMHFPDLNYGLWNSCHWKRNPGYFVATAP